jgi:ketosteroid isomerase-like protein
VPTGKAEAEAATEIRRVVEAQIAVLRAKDAPWSLAHFAPELVVFNLAPPLRRAGPDAEEVDSI